MQNNDQIIKKYAYRLRTIRMMFNKIKNESATRENNNVLRALYSLCRILDMKIVSLKYNDPSSKPRYNPPKKPLFSESSVHTKTSVFE